jgi:hypothetical protein
VLLGDRIDAREATDGLVEIDGLRAVAGTLE